jgi:glycosyltransferase involved in cell wall biosynthesis
MNNKTPLVSILCITYNQEKFVAQAIESFLMQKTDFDFDIVIGDDSSVDGTFEILTAYQANYPGKISVISTGRNMGILPNVVNSTQLCKGKYIALCEGDDYWIDPFKLQKQVDFLEANPDYVMCCHYTKVVDEYGALIYVDPQPAPLVYTYHDLLSGKQRETKTATVVYRNIDEIHQLFKKKWFFGCYAGDKILKLYATQSTGKKIYVMPQVMSCYRNHVGGVWSMINERIIKEKMVSDFNLIIKHFSYPAVMRKKLLLLYIRKYLAFELQKKQLRKAYQTVKYLL